MSEQEEQFEKVRKAIWKATYHKYLELEFDSGNNPTATLDGINRDIGMVWTNLVAVPEEMVAKMIEYSVFFRN